MKMNEIICPDCGQIVKTLTKDGICSLCKKRKTNAKYQGRKYTKLVDIVGTKEYINAMNRRNKSTKSDIENQTTEIDEKKQNLKDEYYSKVKEDINNEFRKQNVNSKYLSTNINLCFDMLNDILSLKTINTIKLAEKIYNDFSMLYLHNQQTLDWSNTQKIIENSLYEKALLEIRRPVKNSLRLYKIIDPIVTYLRNDDKFMTLFNNAICNLSVSIEDIDKPIYRTSISSKLVENNENIVINDSDDTYKYYEMSVPCYGLYGNVKKTLFKTKSPICAKNQELAIMQFKKFLATTFPTVKYDADNIMLEEVHVL